MYHSSASTYIPNFVEIGKTMWMDGSDRSQPPNWIYWLDKNIHDWLTTWQITTGSGGFVVAALVTNGLTDIETGFIRPHRSWRKDADPCRRCRSNNSWWTRDLDRL